MQTRGQAFLVAILVSWTGAGHALAQSPAGGLIATEDGGASGYLHSLERSRFVTGASTEADQRSVEEHGFSKVIGPAGVFATNLRNGLTIAVRSGSAGKGEATSAWDEESSEELMSPDEHNERVVDYFVTAGIPRDQVGGVHANTYLSASGSFDDPMPPAPKIDGYASILERELDGKFSVVDSVAWARMDNRGQVIGEWVYWPAIPATVLGDARRLDEAISGARRDQYLDRLPTGLPPGNIVIRHSSATDEGPFEVFASYDVVQSLVVPSTASAQNMSMIPRTVTVVRHFDVDGEERRLPAERLSLGAPATK